jgi:lipopolysaccharide export LptBFGC system permease protein LptF
LTRLFRWFSIIFFIFALVGIFALWLSDGLHELHFTSVHQRMGALPLICIGLSYISFQLSVERPRSELIKGLLLGIAFVFWGGEQLLPSSSLVTIMDSIVITIFVVDLGLITVEHLKRKDHEIP